MGLGASWKGWKALVAAASALACFCINVVFFCSNKKNGCSKPGVKGKRYQNGISQESEASEALLPDGTEESADAGSDTAQGSNRLGAGLAARPVNAAADPDRSPVAADHASRDAPSVAPADAAAPAGLPSSAQRTTLQDAVADLPRKKQRSVADVQSVEALAPAQQPAGAKPMDTDFLQGLIEAELGPPKFAVAKDAPATHKPASHSRTPPSLEALLDSEFGPPKFAVPKNNGRAANPGVPPRPPIPSHNGQGLADALQPAGAGPAAPYHLRLEVMTGPAAGSVFDTVDQALEVRIGRLPDCTLALSEDPEVSSKHATIHFSVADNCWKMIDVGSLNGSSLNGHTLSTNRQPSTPAPLSSGDILELGSVTRVMVTCTPSTARPATAPATNQPYPTTVTTLPLAGVRNSDPGAVAAGVVGVRVVHAGAGGTVSADPTPRQTGASHQALTAHMLSVVGPPLAVQHHEGLGVSLAVQQRTGADHKRTNTGCEDVAHWELPWCQGATSTLLAIFDGHQGVRAANKAKEVLPQLLRDKLKESGAPGPSGRLLHGRTADAQASLMQALFLETDTAISLDEGCTATVVLMERDHMGHCILQSANVGDSSAVLVQLPGTSQQHLPSQTTLPTATLNGSGRHEQGPGQAVTPQPPAAAPPALSHMATQRRSTTSTAANHLTHLDLGVLPVIHSGSSGDALSPASTQPSFTEHATHAAAPAASRLGAAPVPPHPTALREAATEQPPPTTDTQPSTAVPEAFVVPEGMEGGALDGGGHWIKMSEDHRISSSVKERDRLAALGHKAVRTRLYGLNISRMLGDKFLKDEALGFIADPHVSPRLEVVPGAGTAGVWQHPAPASGPQQGPGVAAVAQGQGEGAAAVAGQGQGRTFLMLASDGLWDVCGEARAAGLIARTIAQDAGTSVAELAGLLLSQAVALRSKDDITVIVVELHALTPST